MFKINNKKIKKFINNNDLLYAICINIKGYGFYFLNNITNYYFDKNKFYRRLGYRLDLKEPKTYNEKIFWKKIYDRNPLLPITADKFLVRNYVKEILGEEIAQKILIPLLYVTSKPLTIPFNTITPPYIIKPNHASGRYIIIKDNHFCENEIIRTCIRWLRTPYGLWNMEWAYKSVPRKIVIERLLLDKDGIIPIDYKFHIFNKKCEFIGVTLDRINNRNIRFFDREWNEITRSNKGNFIERKVPKPLNFETMLKYAETLSANFDYVRVDLYNIDGKIYFGELTHYPASGFKKFIEADLSENWIVRHRYWEENA